MRPSPSAETSRPPSPKVRFFIGSPCVNLAVCLRGNSSSQDRSEELVGFRSDGGTCHFLRLSPILRRHSLPGAESAREGVGILVAEKIGSLCQLQDRVAEVVACHLMTCLIQHALVVRARILQPPLQSPRAHVQVFCNVVHTWTMSRESLLDCSAN